MKAHPTKKHSITQPLLWVSNDYITHSHNCLYSTESRDLVRNRDVAFFVKDRGVKDVKIYFGYHAQIEIDGISPKRADALEKHCKDCGAKIGKEIRAAYYPTFSFGRFLFPSNWFRSERIVLNDEAIIYYSKSLLHTDCTYLPYEDVRVAQYKRGLFGKSIMLFGEQNIMTFFKYSRGNCIEPLQHEIDTHGIKSQHARVRLTWPWFRIFGADVVAMVNDGLCLLAHEYEGGGTYAQRRSYYIPYEDIYHYDKFSWWLLWRTYYIRAKVKNIRKDQKGQNVHFKFRRMGFWCGLYDTLRKSSAKQDKDYHKENKEDYSNYK